MEIMCALISVVFINTLNFSFEINWFKSEVDIAILFL